MMSKDYGNKVIKVGLDLDGVLAEHPLGGVFFYIRQAKEKILKKVKEKKYYYPGTRLERTSWVLINSIRRPNRKGMTVLKSLVDEGKIEAYVITSRFKFLEQMTFRWLKFFKIFDKLKAVYVNSDDKFPNEFKAKTINDLGIEIYIDDDYEAIDFLSKSTKARLFWLSKAPFNPKNGFTKISSLQEALENI